MFAALLLLAGGAPAPAQTLADSIVPAQPRLLLEVPPQGEETFELMQLVLSGSGVPFGLEQADRRPAKVDLASVRHESYLLNGLLIRGALNRITSVDPRYEWEDARDRIVVRGALLHGGGVLNRPIAGLTVDHATLPDMLTALMRAIDPKRPDGGLLPMGARVPAGNDAKAASGNTPGFSMAMGETTVFHALTAVANAANVSWVVRYDSGSGDPEGVSIALVSRAGGVTALSSRSLRASSGAAGPRLLRVFAVPTVATAFGMYAEHVRIRLGVELAPEPMSQLRYGDGPALDLGGSTPTEAIDRITRLDSRLAWAETGGIFSVRPRAGLVPDSPLNRRVEEFMANDDTVDTILDRIAVLLEDRPFLYIGAIRRGRGGGSSALPGSRAEALERASRARRLSFSLRGATIREILDTLCRTQGTLSWTVSPVDQEAKIVVHVDILSWDGWSTSRSVQLPRW